MTCREKVAIENPSSISNLYEGGVMGCPHMHGYLPRPEYCDTIDDSRRCTKCWDREIPGESKPIDIVCTYVIPMEKTRLCDTCGHREICRFRSDYEKVCSAIKTALDSVMTFPREAEMFSIPTPKCSNYSKETVNPRAF